MAKRSHQNYVRVSWIDNQRADLPRIFESDILPTLSGIDRFINTGSISRIAADRRFARSSVDNVVIGRRYRDRADRRNVLFIEKRRPICAAIGRLPDSTSNRPEIISVGFSEHAFDGEGPSAAEGADLPPLHSFKQFFIDHPR